MNHPLQRNTKQSPNKPTNVFQLQQTAKRLAKPSPNIELSHLPKKSKKKIAS